MAGGLEPIVTGIDIGLLILRVAVGAIYVAHGLRKLGWAASDGRTPAGRGEPTARRAAGGEAAPAKQNARGFAGFRESIARRGYRPAGAWAVAAVVAEVVGGVLAIAGLLTPVAAALLVAQSVTIMALVRERGFWVEAMGVEYPLMLGVAALVVGLAGPGSLSVDAALGIEAPWWVFPLLAAAGVTGALVGLATRRPPQRASDEPREPAA
jgi:putative oxidoreductase